MQGHLAGIAENRTRRAEHEFANASFSHGLEKRDCLRYIVVVVFQRISSRFADVYQSGEMHDDVDRLGFQNGANDIGVAHIAFVEGYFRRHSVTMAERKIVEYDGPMTAFDDLTHAMASNVASASHDQYVHNKGLVLIR